MRLDFDYPFFLTFSKLLLPCDYLIFYLGFKAIDLQFYFNSKIEKKILLSTLSEYYWSLYLSSSLVTTLSYCLSNLIRLLFCLSTFLLLLTVLFCEDTSQLCPLAAFSCSLRRLHWEWLGKDRCLWVDALKIIRKLLFRETKSFWRDRWFKANGWSSFWSRPAV